MRLFILVLAILLLPLRGWLGDAMALEMGPPHRMAMSAGHDMAGMDDMTGTTDMAHMTAMTGMADMDHDHAAPTAPDASDTASAQPDCQNTCTACQLCHSVAMTVWPDVAVLSEAPRQTPAFWPSAFASAAPAPGFKPPIS